MLRRNTNTSQGRVASAVAIAPITTSYARRPFPYAIDRLSLPCYNTSNQARCWLVPLVARL
ncbi:MAG TPA: hypothetical protein VFN11_01220 [Ktedonobacterales bacterium]|nr:hypothetical protein [Ktedonobacterales bacterium]